MNWKSKWLSSWLSSALDEKFISFSCKDKLEREISLLTNSRTYDSKLKHKRLAYFCDLPLGFQKVSGTCVSKLASFWPLH